MSGIQNNACVVEITLTVTGRTRTRPDGHDDGAAVLGGNLFTALIIRGVISGGGGGVL